MTKSKPQNLPRIFCWIFKLQNPTQNSSKIYEIWWTCFSISSQQLTKISHKNITPNPCSFIYTRTGKEESVFRLINKNPLTLISNDLDEFPKTCKVDIEITSFKKRIASESFETEENKVFKVTLETDYFRSCQIFWLTSLVSHMLRSLRQRKLRMLASYRFKHLSKSTIHKPSHTE